jgi:hypothetical protein
LQSWIAAAQDDLLSSVSIEVAERKSLSRFTPQHVDLLPENQNLRLKARSRAK